MNKQLVELVKNIKKIKEEIENKEHISINNEN